MCGIAGYIDGSSHKLGSDTLRSMANAIAHRGPDDSGFFESTTRSGTYAVGLAHRRLAIIDLHTGHQPIANEDGSVQIVFNGEIYNFKKLRNQLIALGHIFKTNSDTETIVHAYEEYGEQCVGLFRGMFSFAIWDAKLERLFLARDRFGKKPLFIRKESDTLIFASEIKSLLVTARVDASVDDSAIQDYLLYRYVPAPRTLFRNIAKLPPGSYAVWQDGQLRTERYYSPADLQPYRRSEHLEDPVGSFLEYLDDAVSCRMISDVPFGAFLSGGIDSSAIVGLMARHSELPVKTFSVGFAESQYSELDYARVIAEQFATDHHELVISESDLMDKLPELVHFRDAPIAEPSDIPIYLLAKEARKTVKMVLTGEGSDEMLGGYPKHVYERFTRYYQVIPGLLRRRALEPLVQRLPYRFRRAKTAIATMGIDDYSERMARWFGAVSRREIKQLVLNGGSQKHLTPDWQEYQSGPRSDLRSILSFDQTSWLPDNLLERGDRMTMAASLEARMPFMDHELSEFASSLPDRFRVRGLTTKWLLRKAMTRLLPRAILDRPKVGFRVPVNEWFRGPMRDYLHDHLTSASSMTRNYYNVDELNRLLKEHLSGRQNHEKLLWCLLNLEIWHRVYLKD